MKTDKLLRIYTALFERYGDMNWWPARSPYEVMVGAILTQNTAWSNVEKAIKNFGERLSPQFVENLPISELSEIIMPAGFFNQKARYLKALTAWYGQYDYSVGAVQSALLQRGLAAMRTEILAVNGIGQETADSILLYAFGQPSFVVDAYTKRLFKRFPIDVKSDYNAIKTLFEENIAQNAALYNNFHALIVNNAKEYCRARSVCKGCPLEEICLQQV